MIDGRFDALPGASCNAPEKAPALTRLQLAEALAEAIQSVGADLYRADRWHRQEGAQGLANRDGLAGRAVGRLEPSGVMAHNNRGPGKAGGKEMAIW